MVFTVFEILDMVLMTAVIGYLFKDAFRAPREEREDILEHYRAVSSRWNWHDFWFAAALIAPAILLHEFGHKFVAMAFGAQATFHGACSTSALVTGTGFLDMFCGIQLLAVVLKTIGFGFLFFVPGYVSITGNITQLQGAMTSFAGPAVHLLFWVGSAWYVRGKARMRALSERKRMFLFFFKQVNMFLFILNMIPIPGFDGYWVLVHLFRAFSG